MKVAEAELTHTEELARAERPPRQEKVEEIERLKTILSEAAGVFLTDFRGIDVAKMNALRLRFREAGVEYTVVKNNLLKRAADGIGLEGWIADLEGPTALAVGMQDPVAPARVIKEFQDDHTREADLLAFKGGLLRGEAIKVDIYMRLAAMPDRDVLIAKILYMLAYPTRGLVTALSDVSRRLVYALNDLRQRLDAEIESVGEPEEAEPETETEIEVEVETKEVTEVEAEAEAEAEVKAEAEVETEAEAETAAKEVTEVEAEAEVEAEVETEAEAEAEVEKEAETEVEAEVKEEAESAEGYEPDEKGE